MNIKYKEILRYFASCGLYRYGDIGIPYRVEYIDPILKSLNKNIEEFDLDMQRENKSLIREMEENFSKLQHSEELRLQDIYELENNFSESSEFNKIY